MDLNKIYFENCIVTMERMQSESVPLIVTSPVYDKLRTYVGYEFNFELIAQYMTMVLMPGGVICWVVNDSTINGSETLTSCKQKIFFVEQCGLRVHDTMIYQKLNFSHPEKGRYHQVFEYVFILSKGTPRTFNPIFDRRNISAGKIGSLGQNTFTQKDGGKLIRKKKVNTEFGMRHNIWLGKTRGQEEMCKKLKHPAMMPKWLARDLVRSFSNEGDLVYDPMAGSGTVCQESEKLNRIFVGSEMGSEYSQFFTS